MIIISVFINFFISKCIIKIISISINHHFFSNVCQRFAAKRSLLTDLKERNENKKTTRRRMVTSFTKF